MKKINYLLALLVLIILSCSESVAPLPDAEYLSVNDIIQSPPNYFWFAAEFNSYYPDTDLVQQIATVFNVDNHKVLYFVKPSCSCTRSQKAFPASVRVLKDANIPDSCSEIYSMVDIKCKNPYENIIKLHQLPAIYILKNGVPIYALKDTLDNLRSINPDSGKVEVLLYNALTK